MADHANDGSDRLNVFLDTEAIVGAGFFPGHGSDFAQLLDLSQARELTLFTTTITIRESLRKFREMIAKDLDKIESNRALRNYQGSEYEQVKRFSSSSDLREKAVLDLKQFMEANFSVIPLDYSTGPRVMDLHFFMEPPFRAKAKENEFRDAFVLTALDAWCDKHNQTVTVVSGDPEFGDYCDGSQKLTACKSVRDLLRDLPPRKPKRPPNTLEDALPAAINAAQDEIRREFLSRTLETGMADLTFRTVAIERIIIFGSEIAKEGELSGKVKAWISVGSEVSFNTWISTWPEQDGIPSWPNPLLRDAYASIDLIVGFRAVWSKTLDSTPAIEDLRFVRDATHGVELQPNDPLILQVRPTLAP